MNQHPETNTTVAAPVRLHIKVAYLNVRVIVLLCGDIP
jgi:hypothetical protein